MVVAEVLTTVANTKSVKFIKDNISTAQDIGQIAGQIDNLLTGEKQVQEQRAKKSWRRNQRPVRYQQGRARSYRC